MHKLKSHTVNPQCWCPNIKRLAHATIARRLKDVCQFPMPLLGIRLISWFPLPGSRFWYKFRILGSCASFQCLVSRFLRTVSDSFLGFRFRVSDSRVTFRNLVSRCLRPVSDSWASFRFLVSETFVTPLNPIPQI